MGRVRNVRYAVALSVIVLAGVGFATRIGDHSARYVVMVYLLLAGMFVLTAGMAYADNRGGEWFS